MQWLPLLLAVGAATLLVTAGGWSVGLRDGWAFNFFLYVPVGLRWAAAGLLVLAGLPWVGTWLVRHLPMRTVPPATAWPSRWGWVALPAALALFWLGRERTWYGDAHHKLALLAEASPHTNPYVWKEPLNSLMEYAAMGLVARLGAPPETGIALLSIVAGGVYGVAAVMLARQIDAPAWLRGSLVVALFATGSSQLWFGHIENYSWSTALALWTLALALAYLRQGIPLWAVGLAGGAAVSMHPQAAFILPGLLALVRRDRWPRLITILAVSGAVVPALTVAYLLLGLRVPLPTMGNGYAGDDQLFWTAAQALAPAQLSASLQNLWLIVLPWPLWLIGGLWAMRRTPDRGLLVMGLAALGVLFYHFAFQNDLPRPRDWDLYAIVGPIVTAWGALAWTRLLPTLSTQIARTVAHLLLVALLLAAFHAAAWVGVNAAYTLLRPNPHERDYYARYRLVDLTTRLDTATVTPASPICDGPVGCERVMLTEFVMPHTGDHRPTIFAHAPARIAIPLTIPRTPIFLWLSPALDPQAWEWGGDGVTFRVSIATEAGEELLWSQHRTPADPAQRDWGQALIPLDRYRGRTVTLILTTDPGPAGDDAADRAGWGLPWVVAGTLDVRRD